MLRYLRQYRKLDQLDIKSSNFKSSPKHFYTSDNPPFSSLGDNPVGLGVLVV